MEHEPDNILIKSTASVQFWGFTGQWVGRHLKPKEQEANYHVTIKIYCELIIQLPKTVCIERINTQGTWNVTVGGKLLEKIELE